MFSRCFLEDNDLTSSSSSSNHSDSAPEIWESDSEPDEESFCLQASNITRINYVLSYFLLFFQLCYHVSDRGLKHILNLLSSIFKYLSVILQNSEFILQLSFNFPRTLYSLKKEFDVKTLDRYCVCPSCHSVCEEATCTIAGPGNVMITRKCDYVEFPAHPQKSRRSKMCNGPDEESEGWEKISA